VVWATDAPMLFGDFVVVCERIVAFAVGYRRRLTTSPWTWTADAAQGALTQGLLLQMKSL